MLRETKYGQFTQTMLDNIRELDVSDVTAELGGDASGKIRRHQAILAWLKTDAKIGKDVIAVLEKCPFVSNGSEIEILRNQVAQLRAQIASKKKKK